MAHNPMQYPCHRSTGQTRRAIQTGLRCRAATFANKNRRVAESGGQSILGAGFDGYSEPPCCAPFQDRSAPRQCELRFGFRPRLRHEVACGPLSASGAVPPQEKTEIVRAA